MICNFGMRSHDFSVNNMSLLQNRRNYFREGKLIEDEKECK